MSHTLRRDFSHAVIALIFLISAPVTSEIFVFLVVAGVGSAWQYLGNTLIKIIWPALILQQQHQPTALPCLGSSVSLHSDYRLGYTIYWSEVMVIIRRLVANKIFQSRYRDIPLFFLLLDSLTINSTKFGPLSYVNVSIKIQEGGMFSIGLRY